MLQPAASLLLVILPVVLAGCQSGFERYYVPQDLGRTYPPVAQVRILEVGAQDLGEVQQRLFPGAALLGVSEFRAGGQSRADLDRFARSLGADVVLWQQAFAGSELRSGYYTVPATETMRVTTTDAQGKPQVTTVTALRHDYIPYSSSYDLYHHRVVFLRTTGAGPAGAEGPAPAPSP